MSSLILDSNSPIQPAFDPYWDKPMSRREAHRLFMKLASNDNELTGMADTASILINFLCEKLEVKREDVDAYVARKHLELAAMREKMRVEEKSNDLGSEAKVQ
jgi:hypothetical protein